MKGQHVLHSRSLGSFEVNMKRQKRDKLSRAHAKGYQAGITGRSKDNCPFQDTNTRSQWLGGWRAAMEDRGMGLAKV